MARTVTPVHRADGVDIRAEVVWGVDETTSLVTARVMALRRAGPAVRLTGALFL